MISLKLLSETFLILRIERYMIKNVCYSSCKVPFFWILKKIKFFGLISKKYPNIKFHENPSSGSLVVLCGRMDAQTDMAKLIAAFCNFETRLGPKTFVSPVITQFSRRVPSQPLTLSAICYRRTHTSGNIAFLSFCCRKST